MSRTQEKHYDNLVVAVEDLKKRGFNASFSFEGDGLHSLKTSKVYGPKQIEIHEFHRFEGATDYEDMSILYGLSTDSGEKGILIDAYGTYANRDLGEFMKKAEFE